MVNFIIVQNYASTSLQNKRDIDVGRCNLESKSCISRFRKANKCFYSFSSSNWFFFLFSFPHSFSSFYIHQVTYSIRWHTTDLTTICGNEDCFVGYKDFYLGTVAFYILWQILYLLKTEVLDLKTLKEDKEIMTSLRWLSEKKPHPILVFLRKRNIKTKPIFLLMTFQLLITMVVILPVPLFWNYKSAHIAVLILVFCISIWNAAGFYFEVLTRPSKKSNRVTEKAKPVKKISSSFSRFIGFIIFLSISIFSFLLLYKFLI